jgi:class I fructose-bisphosphate aldolase
MQTATRPSTVTAPVETITSAVSSGKRYRMGRLFAEDGRSVIFPADHGLNLGRVQGLEHPVEMVGRFLNLGADGFLISAGVARRTADLFAHRGAPARLLTLDTYYRGDTGAQVLATTLQEAATLGIDGVKVLMPWDVPADERADRSRLIAGIISEAEGHGLPVMVEPICLSDPRPADAVAIEADGGRMAAELGADIIKVAYPGDPEILSSWCAELGVPVVLLGGPAGGDDDELCRDVADAVAAGASGITIGRRVWQRPLDDATELFGRLVAIVHPD